jgi:hypothetical protein
MEFHSPKRGVVENARTVNKTCPRCHNNVDFVLVYAKSGIGFGKTLLITTKTKYELHCPICLHYEDISESLRKSLIC